MKPYYQEDGITIYHGDCREVLSELEPDLLIADPNYGETSLSWDERCSNWTMVIPFSVRQLWCFGSMRFFLEMSRFNFNGWRFAQDLVWEKQNGSGFAVDRFNRTHEL